MLSRFPDWPARLEVFLASNRERKFRYGSWDCSLFVAEAIFVMTGVDLAFPYRGYCSRAEAVSKARGLAGAPSVQAIAENAATGQGMPEIAVLQAQRGDMALIRRARDYSMGLVALNGQELLIALKIGFGSIPLTRAVRAWRV